MQIIENKNIKQHKTINLNSNNASPMYSAYSIKSLFDNFETLLINLSNYLDHINKISKFHQQLSYPNYISCKLTRTIGLFISITLIVFSYYIFTFWHLIPNVESYHIDTHILKTINISNSLLKSKQHNSINQLIIFNVLFFMFIWCFISTALKNPGYISDKYVSLV